MPGLASPLWFVEKQKQEDEEKIKKLQDQVEEQKLLAGCLVGSSEYT